MRAFEFLREELSKNKKIFILLFAECFFTFLISGFCLTFLLDAHATADAIGDMSKSESWYHLHNNKDYGKSSDGNFKSEEWNEFYHYIIENYDYVMTTGELMIIEDSFTWENGITDNAIGISYYTENHFDLLNPGGAGGYDWESYGGEYVPVVLGYAYKDYYRVGDVINSTWEVVGFRAEGTQAIPIVSGYRLVDNDGGITTVMKYYDSDFYYSSTTDICVYAETPNELLDVLEKAEALGLDSVVPVSFSDSIAHRLKLFYRFFSSYFFIAAGITAFSILCTSSGFSNYIRMRKRDYLICEICGADIHKIALNIALLNLLVILSAVLLCTLIFRRIDLLPIFLIITAVIEICSLFKPLYSLLKKPLIEQYYENR